MKIQINGFDIEVNTEESNMTVKVLDSTGKELSNNTYTQSSTTVDEVKPVEVPSAEDIAAEPAVQEETPQAQEEAQEETPEAQASAVIEETEEAQTDESFVPDFETFKKLRNAGKI